MNNKKCLVFVNTVTYSLNHIQLSLFMLREVNIGISRPFLCFRCLTKLIIRLNHEAIFISRILHCLTHIQLPLFMLRKVNFAILRPFLFFHCLTKLIIRLNDEVILISLLFRFLYSLNVMKNPKYEDSLVI